MSEYIITSNRLGLRQWSENDHDAFAKMNADAKVMEHFPYLMTREQTDAYLKRIYAHFKEYGYGVYAVDVLESGEFIGYIGFSCPTWEAYFTPCVEVGWRLKSEHWNNGYATEGAKACLEYGFKSLGFDAIYSWTALDNLASERVMQKIGLIKIDEFDHPRIQKGHRLERHVLYELKKDTHLNFRNN